MFELYTAAILAFLPDLALALAIFAAFYIMSRVFVKLIMKAGSTGKLGRENVYQLLASTARVVTLILGILTSLSTIGIDMTPLIAGLGLSGLAISLALKDAVTNLINGILILFYQPFVQGDTIQIGKAKGVVGEINLRFVQLIDEETGAEFLVPNSQAFAKEIQIFKKEDKS